MRPIIAWHCSKPWTPEDDRELRAHLALLQGEIDSAGGPAAWVQVGLETWLRGSPPRPCRIPRLHPAPPKRQPAV